MPKSALEQCQVEPGHKAKIADRGTDWSELKEFDGLEKKEAKQEAKSMLEEGLEEYHLDLPVIGLTEMLAEYLVEDEPAE